GAVHIHVYRISEDGSAPNGQPLHALVADDDPRGDVARVFRSSSRDPDLGEPLEADRALCTSDRALLSVWRCFFGDGVPIGARSFGPEARRSRACDVPHRVQQRQAAYPQGPRAAWRRISARGPRPRRGGRGRMNDAGAVVDGLAIALLAVALFSVTVRGLVAGVWLLIVPSVLLS